MSDSTSTSAPEVALIERVQSAPGSGREILDPATGALVGHAPVHSVGDLDDAIERARRAQPGWDALGHAERSALMLKAADAIDEHAEALARLLSREQGKPLNGPNARFELGACSAWLKTSATTILEAEVIIDDGDAHAVLTYKPVGVVGAIGPWNWPLMITIWQIGPHSGWATRLSSSPASTPR